MEKAARKGSLFVIYILKYCRKKAPGRKFTFMKKVLLLLLVCSALVMCKSKKTVSGEAGKEISSPDIQHRDDFRAASDKERTALIKKLRAADAAYSILVLTKGFKGEKMIVSTSGKTVYSGNFISNLKSGVAGTVRIQNSADTKIYDDFTKTEVILEASETQKHKYIYLMKDNTRKGSPYMITYSNTLRPLK